MSDKIEWGPEIRVVGEDQPEYLRSDDVLSYYTRADRSDWTSAIEPRWWGAWTEASWDAVRGIRLPANHPYYVTPTPLDEAAQAAIALVERMATHGGELGHYDEARRIADLPSFPKAIDPVKEEAARLYREACSGTDGCPTWEGALENALRRGIELGKEGKA